ncbi:hypothetical protein PPACK8108_LOCUS23767, partial [Phakopsora pachyrhizi]
YRWCPTNPRLFALSSSSPNASSARSNKAGSTECSLPSCYQTFEMLLRYDSKSDTLFSNSCYLIPLRFLRL